MHTEIRTPGDAIREIIQGCAARHRISMSVILRNGYTGSRKGAHARQEACWKLRDIRRPDGKAKLSYPRIAKIMGYKDHTSVIHSVRAYEHRMMM